MRLILHHLPVAVLSAGSILAQTLGNSATLAILFWLAAALAVFRPEPKQANG